MAKSKRPNKTCVGYKNEGRREKNKKKKIAKHLAKHPADKQSLRALERL